MNDITYYNFSNSTIIFYIMYSSVYEYKINVCKLSMESSNTYNVVTLYKLYSSFCFSGIQIRSNFNV